MSKNNFILFFILYTLTFSGTVFSKELLGTEQLAYNTLSEQLTTDQLQEVIRINNLWGWVSYLILPLLLYVKILLITILLSNGAFFFEQKTRFKDLFNIVLKAEFVFLLPMIIKTIRFYFKNTYTLTDLQYYIPLSLESLFGYKNVEPWYIYPMQVGNLFEVIYWIILVVLLARYLQVTKSKAFGIVASSYGSGLIIWTACVMFLTLNMN